MNRQRHLKYHIERSNLVVGIDYQDHRGPDGKGIWSDDDHSVVLGHNRLSIIDLSDTGAQPMEDISGRYVITYNGELYNYKNLKKAFKENLVLSSEDLVIQKFF